MENQKVDPTPGLDRTPTRPPSTATCLLQMLRPSPVPPLLRGRFISSSLPCNICLELMPPLFTINFPCFFLNCVKSYLQWAYLNKLLEQGPKPLRPNAHTGICNLKE